MGERAIYRGSEWDPLFGPRFGVLPRVKNKTAYVKNKTEGSKMRSQIQVLNQVLKRGIQTPDTSSLGTIYSLGAPRSYVHSLPLLRNDAARALYYI